MVHVKTSSVQDDRKKTGFESRTNRGGFLRMTSILHGLFIILTRERGVWCGSGIDFDAPLDYCVICCS